MIKQLRWLLLVIVFLHFVAAAQEDCPILVEEALNTVSEVCADTSRNQACYGNLTLEAEPQPTTAAFQFNMPGDKVNIADIRALRLTGMDKDVPEWGIAVMKVQANNIFAALPGQSITFLLFGEVEHTAAEPALTKLDVTPKGDYRVNVRARPSDSAKVLNYIGPTTVMTVIGRLADASWLAIPMPGGELGWVSTELVMVYGNVQSLSVYDSETVRFYGPMKAFYLKTGIGDATCQEAPNSGLLIQTPKGAGKIDFLIDGVEIQLGSTVYIQAEAGHALFIYVLEGEAVVRAFNVSRTAQAGEVVSVLIDEDLAPIAEPFEAEPYDMDDLQALPITLLEDEITIVPPSDTANAEVESCLVTASNIVNLRRGPGTNYPRAGILDAQESRRPDGQATGLDGLIWWHFDDGAWVRSDVVEKTGACENVTIVADIPPAPTAAPTAVGTQAPSAPNSSPSTGSATLTLINECEGGDTVHITGPTTMTVFVDGNSSTQVSLQPGTYDIVAIYNDNGCDVVEGTAYGVQIPGYDAFLACPPANFCN